MVRLVALLVTGLTFLASSSQGSIIVAEKGQSVEFTCNVSKTVSSVTWQLIDRYYLVTLSNCSVANKVCVDKMPALYSSYIANSGLPTLKIKDGARVDQKEFRCVADNGEDDYFSLEVYVWPTKPVCSQKLTNSHVEYTCTTANGYPNITATLHRQKVGFADIYITKCSMFPYQNDTDDDYWASCTFKIPLSEMRLNQTVYIEMKVLNQSVINKPAAVSDDILTRLSVPTVGLYPKDCPAGPGVRRQSVLTGTTAKCKCSLAINGLPIGLARWYDKNGQVVGSENTTDKSSTLTFSYISSDPIQSYQCKPWTNLSSELVHAITYSPTFRCTYTTLEKGQSTTIQCPVLDTVGNIIWQRSDGFTVVNISTCSFVDNTCTSLSPLVYNGFIINSDGIKAAGLTVTSARVNEQFSFLSDIDSHPTASELEVYAWPKTPICVEDISGAFLQITCTTDNVYPSVVAVLYRRDASSEVSFMNNSGCTLGVYGSGSEGDYTASCTWTIPIEKISPGEYFHAEMSSNVSITINRTVAKSEEWLTKITWSSTVIPGTV